MGDGLYELSEKNPRAAGAMFEMFAENVMRVSKGLPLIQDEAFQNLSELPPEYVQQRLENEPRFYPYGKFEADGRIEDKVLYSQITPDRIRETNAAKKQDLIPETTGLIEPEKEWPALLVPKEEFTTNGRWISISQHTGEITSITESNAYTQDIQIT